MIYANYAAFRSALKWALDSDGSNVAANGLPPTRHNEVLDLVIAAAESRVYRDLRASSMVTDLSASVTSNAATLPADLLELKEVYFSDKRPLEIIPLDRLREAEIHGSGGDARMCAQDGDTLRFYPDASGTVLGSYYKRHEPLETGTWGNQTTFARYPEVFLYAALCEAMPLLGMDARAPVWDAKYSQAIANAMQDEQVRVYGGGPLRVRTR